MKNGKPFPVPVRVSYSCSKCPAYCCSYSEIEATPRDIERIARHFGVTYTQAEERYTKPDDKGAVRIMRHRRDKVFDSTCMMLDQEKRRCTIYEARRGVCRKYPDSSRCGYYDFLRFERAQQGDPEWVALT